MRNLVQAAFICGLVALFFYAEVAGQDRKAFVRQADDLLTQIETKTAVSGQVELKQDIQTFKTSLLNKIEKNENQLKTSEVNVNKDKVAKFEERLKGLVVAKPATNENTAVGTNTNNDRNANTNPATNASSRTGTRTEGNSEAEANESVGFLTWILYGTTAILLLGSVTFGIVIFRRAKSRERSEIRAGFSDLRNKNKVLDQKIEAINGNLAELGRLVAQQKSDLGRMRQNVSSVAPTFSPPPAPVVEVPKEIPRFPVAVTEYLSTSGRGAAPVRFDYKEGILVADTTGDGGLSVVQDNGQTYLIPSFGFFQTKSDYTNYFERYYSCAKPAGGNVWIRQPATVHQVAGGWQLSSPGELEIR